MAILAGPRGEMMRIARPGCQMGGAGVSSLGGMKCGLRTWNRRVAVVAVGRAERRTCWGAHVGGCAAGDCC
jgi:hypothetical protein